MTLRGDATRCPAAARARQAQVELDGWIRAASALDVDEVRIAAEAGYSRPTIRKHLGK